MTNHSRQNMVLSTFMSTAGAVGGCAIAGKLAGKQAAISFLKFGVLMVLVLLIIQIFFLRKSEKRAIYLVLFNIVFSFGIVWFMLCLILPLFWVASMGFGIKFSLSLFSAGLWIVNVMKGVRIFKLKWADVGAKLLARYYRKKQREIDWHSLVGSLKMSVSLYIPGVPEVFIPVVTLLTVVSMFAGLSLRRVYPEFSLFAWGIPTVTVISIFMQMIGFGVGQLLELNALEKEEGAIIRPV